MYEHQACSIVLTCMPDVFCPYTLVSPLHKFYGNFKLFYRLSSEKPNFSDDVCYNCASKGNSEPVHKYISQDTDSDVRSGQLAYQVVTF